MRKNLLASICALLYIALVLVPFISILLGYTEHLVNKTNDLVAPDVKTINDQYFKLVADKDLDAILKMSDKKLFNDSFKEEFSKIAAELPPNPTSVKIVTVREGTAVTDKLPLVSISSEHLYPDKTMLTELVVKKLDNEYVVMGMHWYELPMPIEEAHRFKLLGQTPTHYIVLGAAFLILLFNTYALYLCILAPIPHWKWAWITFILVGFCSFTFKWTQGNITFSPFWFNFPVVSITQMVFHPVTIIMTVPFGAITFFLRRHKLIA